MSAVSIAGLTKRFDGKPPTMAVDSLSIDIESGEFLVLLGPSGCGKSTTLRCLAGLDNPDQGRIEIGRKPVFDSASRTKVPPDKRNIGMVFQSFALWPHMSVGKNIGYPLRVRSGGGGRRDSAYAERVRKAASLVECENLLDRYPGQLSGGQQQRVALARGLVAEPDVVLLDEPMSNLDARLRKQLRSQIHELHQRIGFTAVFVTHDQSEAIALGDRLVVMRAGRIEQLGSPREIFSGPVNEYVAGFVGFANRLPLRNLENSASQGSGVVRTPEGHAIDGVTVIRFRPEHGALVPVAAEVDLSAFTATCTVVDVQFAGLHYDVMVTVGATKVEVRVPATDTWIERMVGGDLTLVVRQEDTVAFDASEQRVRVGSRPSVVLTEASSAAARADAQEVGA